MVVSRSDKRPHLGPPKHYSDEKVKQWSGPLNVEPRERVPIPAAEEIPLVANVSPEQPRRPLGQPPAPEPKTHVTFTELQTLPTAALFFSTHPQSRSNAS